MFVPYVRRLGSPSFRGWLFDLIPSTMTKTIKEIVDTMDIESRKIYTAAKTSLEAGDDDAVQRMGEGKDIMSVLRMYSMLLTMQLKADPTHP